LNITHTFHYFLGKFYGGSKHPDYAPPMFAHQYGYQTRTNGFFSNSKKRHMPVSESTTLM